MANDQTCQICIHRVCKFFHEEFEKRFPWVTGENFTRELYRFQRELASECDHFQEDFDILRDCQHGWGYR